MPRLRPTPDAQFPGPPVLLPAEQFLPSSIIASWRTSLDISEWLRRHGHTVVAQATTTRGGRPFHAYARTATGHTVHLDGYITLARGARG
jgi:hypothetical protein